MVVFWSTPQETCTTAGQEQNDSGTSDAPDAMFATELCEAGQQELKTLSGAMSEVILAFPMAPWCSELEESIVSAMTTLDSVHFNIEIAKFAEDIVTVVNDNKLPHLEVMGKFESLVTKASSIF